MATSILVNPLASTSEIGILSNCFEWTITSDDIGDGVNTINKSLYRLKCITTGEYLTDPDGDWIVPCKNGELIRINYQSLLQRSLSTRVPDCSLPLIKDGTIKKEVQLEVGTSYIDLQDCTKSEIKWEAESDPYTVINSYYQPWEDPPSAFVSGSLNSSPDVILNTLPRKKELCRDSQDYYYYCGDATTMEVTAYLCTGLKIAAKLNIPSGKENVCIVDIGPAVMSGLSWTATGGLSIPATFDPCKVKWYKIAHGQDFGSTTYHIKNCCCDEGGRIDLYFLDPRGGYSLLNMGCSDRINVEKSGIQVCRESTNCSIDERNLISKFGKQFLYKDRMLKIELSRKIRMNKGNYAFFMAFANAGHYVAKYRCADEGKKNLLSGLVLTSTDLPVHQDSGYVDYNLTGYYSNGSVGHSNNFSI